MAVSFGTVGIDGDKGEGGRGPPDEGDAFLLGARAAAVVARSRATTLGGLGIPARDAGAVLT